jgi:hypothetical protein
MTINPTIPTVGSPRGSEEIDIVNALTTIVAAVNAGTGPAVVASLPLAPTDGQEVYYVADAVNGVIWHLKYRAASPSAYKWEYVGGQSMLSLAAIDMVPAATGATWTEPTTNVRVTVPLAGDYRIEYGLSGGANSAVNMHMGVKLGAVDPTGISNGSRAHIFGSASNLRLPHRRLYPAAGVAAATVLALVYLSDAATGQIAAPYLSVLPTRVG